MTVEYILRLSNKRYFSYLKVKQNTFKVYEVDFDEAIPFRSIKEAELFADVVNNGTKIKTGSNFGKKIISESGNKVVEITEIKTTTKVVSRRKL